MTRISEEAVEAAAEVILVAATGRDNLTPTAIRGYSPLARAVLLAALPHLTDDGVGAPPECTGCYFPPTDDVPEEPSYPDVDPACPVHGEGATPAIDRDAAIDGIVDNYGQGERTRAERIVDSVLSLAIGRAS